jgi:phytoene dehydrogenase-like protein
MDKTVTIIGAGIAGLSAGCYGQMNGYRTQIFEMGQNPGGLCTAWSRKGYTIDGCIHWLVGSSPKSEFYKIWAELGAIQDRSFVDHDALLRVEGADGKEFVVYSDLDRLNQHMEDLAPEDRDTIEDFIGAIRTSTRHDPPVEKAPELYTPADGLKMANRLPLLRVVRKWGKISVQEFASLFRNPFLRESFPAVFNMADFPMAGMIITLAWLHNKAAGYPIGGSLDFAKAIEKRYLGLGGNIYYDSRVVKIITENDRAVGIRLESGEEHRSDVVISAADGHSTIFDMLDGRYADDTVRGYYDNFPIFPPLLYISLGIKRNLKDIPSSVMGINFPLRKPLAVDDRTLDRMTAQVYNFDPTLAPEGGTVARVMITSDYERWKGLRERPAEYRAEKKKAADTVISALEERFPGISSDIDMVDVATPITFQRYTGNWRGSFEGWLPTVDNFGNRMSKTLPGLGSFYMIGQWVEPGGGLPPAATSGRNVVQILCHHDGIKFKTTVP